GIGQKGSRIEVFRDEPAFVHRCGGHGRGRGRSGCCRSHRGGWRYRRLLGWRLGAFEAAVVGVTKAVVATLCHGRLAAAAAQTSHQVNNGECNQADEDGTGEEFKQGAAQAKVGQQGSDTQTGCNAGDGAEEARHATTLSGGCSAGSGTRGRRRGATRGIGVGRRRCGRRALSGHVAGLGAEAFATTGAARLSVKGHGQHPDRRNRQNSHGEESRKTLRHYECLLYAPGNCRARVKKSLTRSESYRKLKKRTMPWV